MGLGKKAQQAFFCWGLALMSLPALARGERMADEFPMKQAPSKADWRAFIQSSEAERQQLWVYETGRGRHLQDWSWGWRLGWVRVCGRSPAEFCSAVLQEALLDRAMVVRAEAASAIGRQYENSGNAAAVRLLAEAYHNQRNVRRGKPLFIQQRILFAMHQIGGDRAAEWGRRLASERPEATAYWRQLEGDVQ